MRDAIVFMHDEFEAPDTGSLRGDYEAIAAPGARAAQRAGAATFMPRLLGEAVNDPELHAIFYEQPRRAAPRPDALVLERAVARGEIRDDVDVELMIDLFAGPAVYRLLITGGDMSKMFARRGPARRAAQRAARALHLPHLRELDIAQAAGVLDEALEHRHAVAAPDHLRVHATTSTPPSTCSCM